MLQSMSSDDRRKTRIRSKLKKVSSGKPRLTVHRTNCHVYAQLISDSESKTIASASTLEATQFEGIKRGCNKESASKVGELIAKRALEAGVKEIVFDRSGYQYHGRVKALAEAARQNGLVF